MVTFNQLKKGIQHEAQEHKDVTHGDQKIAEKIAMAHLKEDPQYYTHLSVMEEAVKKKQAIKGAINAIK
jgi:hypothetical protein